MQLISRHLKSFRMAALLCPAIVLAACDAQNPLGQTDAEPKAAQPAPVPKADFLTEGAYFKQLQNAGLRADYAAFAGYLRDPAPTAIVAALQQSFAGRPFDAYTAKIQNTRTAHKRIIELRGTSGRLYLYLELDKVAGGWNFSEYQLDRNRQKVIRRL